MKKRFLRVIPSIRFVNYRMAYPMASPGLWHRWFQVTRYWRGRIVEVSVRHWAIKLDFRRDMVRDMIAAAG